MIDQCCSDRHLVIAHDQFSFACDLRASKSSDEFDPS
jgi:hypothetical protein